MVIKSRKDNETITIYFTDLQKGQLDLSEVDVIRKKFSNIIMQNNNKNIILNFENVEYIDSSIIGCIVDLFNDIRNNGGSFKLINVGKNIFEILEMTNLTRFLDISKK